jgi:putative CocE/NonD family hydrolase
MDMSSAFDAAIYVLWGVKIPLRDGVLLHANAYLPRNHVAASPAVFTLTPYTAQKYHAQGVYFASHGFPFLTVDVRGRGNSGGVFRPFINEGRDGFDVVEWVAKQPYCNGKVAMWGGSYAGLNQWTAAAKAPPHLASIVPAAAVAIGVDFPMRGGMTWPYVMQWLTLTSGRASQETIFEDHLFWAQAFRQWFESGRPFKELDGFLGGRSEIFQEWISHPEQNAYWDQYGLSGEEYRGVDIPALTITGIYDNAQRGALMHYKKHLQATEGRTQHCLVIGPWDHAGTRTPRANFGGLSFGPQSLVDLPKLHLEWYAWTMQQGPRPEFLKKDVAYYVTGLECWRYTDTLAEVTTERKPFYLESVTGASSIFGSGLLRAEPGNGGPDEYVYDPADVDIAKLEAEISDPLCLRPAFPTDTLTDQMHVYARDGRQLVYHSETFAADLGIIGFFALTVWLSIDQADTDIGVAVYDIDRGGGSVLLTSDCLRARHRDGLHEAKLVSTSAPLRYVFEGFTFVSHRMRKGSRLRLVIGPIDSIFSQKNYNSGGVVSDESMEDARVVTVRLFHNRDFPSVLLVPLGRTDPQLCAS